MPSRVAKTLLTMSAPHFNDQEFRYSSKALELLASRTSANVLKKVACKLLLSGAVSRSADASKTAGAREARKAQGTEDVGSASTSHKRRKI